MSEAPWPGNESLPPSVARRVDALCNRFEQAWKEGRPPVIEDYLAEIAEPERDALLRELLPLEADYRRRGGEEPRPEDYRGRFPALDTDWLAHAVAATPASTDPGTQHPPEAQAPGATGPTEGPGTHIGPYKLLQPIGEGGMGAVWLADQEQPVRRQVALKIIKPGMDSRQVIARFEAERQALALMDHPHIAKVLDAGTTAAGRPFFVMELVKGVPLTRFCDERRLTPRQRLELVIPVCQAVQHAHQKGIIHRDLKPSNILVALYDGQPVPKVIDFGVAKATGPKLTEHTLFTAFGAVVGTLDYMAPEQAEVNQLDIDTRADIYSLGVILYELLTGSTPLQRGRLKKVALVEVLRLIREQEPPKPSTRLSTSETLPSVAALRGCEPAKLTKLVRGELDWIVMKCLEKDRERRYETANGLARDLQRYLADEPVQAGPPSATYRLRKLARKYRTALLTAAAFVGLLVAAAVVSTWQAFEKDGQRRRAEAAEANATAERDRVIEEKNRADQEAAIATAVRRFLQEDLLRQADTKRQADRQFTPDPDVKVRTLLDRAAAGIGERFGDQPLVAAAIREAIGDAYGGVGAYPQAIDHLSTARTLRTTHQGPDHPDTLVTLNHLAAVYQAAGKWTEAIQLCEEVRAKNVAQHGPDHPVTRNSTYNLAVAYLHAGRTAEAIPLLEQPKPPGPSSSDRFLILNARGMAAGYQGKYAEAELLLEKAVELRSRFNGEEHPKTLMSLNNLALVYQDQGKYAQAETMYAKMLAVCRRVRGETHPDTLMAMNRLAAVYRSLDKDAQAEDLCVKVVELRRQVLGDEHPHTLASRCLLALLHKGQGRFAEAEALENQVLASCRRVLGEEHQDTLIARINLAYTYYLQGQYASAEKLLQDTLEMERRALGPEHPETLYALVKLGKALRAQGRYGDAEPLLAQAVEVRRRTSGPAHPATLEAMQALALLDEDQGKLDAAEQLYAQVLAVRRRGPTPDSPQVADTLAFLGRNLVKQRKYAQAELLLREGLKIHESKQPQKWSRFQCQALLGASLAGQQHYAEAEALLLAGCEGMKSRQQAIAVPDHTCLTEALEQLVGLYAAWGKPDEAQKWRAERAKVPKPPESPKAK